MQEGSTGLYYMRARYYDAATGRFTGADPQFAARVAESLQDSRFAGYVAEQITDVSPPRWERSTGFRSTKPRSCFVVPTGFWNGSTSLTVATRTDSSRSDSSRAAMRYDSSSLTGSN
jgi:hypothetical protein